VRAKSEVARAKSELDRMTVMSKNAEDKLADTREYFRQKATTPFDLRDAVAAADAARVQVETARVAVRTAEAALAGAERALEWANAGRTAAVAALATADNVIKVSDAAVRKAEADVNVAKAAAAAAKALRDQDQWRLDNCRVLAPISGVVLERSANVGDYVTEGGGRGGIANSQFVTLADTDNLRVEVDVTEQDVSKLAKGMPCTIIPDAFKDKAFKGRVMWIDPLGNYSKATVQVKVRIDKTRADDDFLRIEGAAKVEFRPTPPAAAPGSPGAAPTADDKPSIWIPASALAGATDPRVQTLDNEGRVRTATVKLGMRSGSQVQVLEGLTPGQTLVTDWQKDAKDGDLLKPPAAK
jgi:RND family efflux transporter MFP subunit